jgi:hypothetical protein
MFVPLSRALVNRGGGTVHGAKGETWRALDDTLRQGCRGLPGRSPLARLLAEHRGARNRADLPPLTEAGILAWAEAYRRRTGRWPTAETGPIPEAPGETWRAVAVALVQGLRGLRDGDSLARLIDSGNELRRGTPGPAWSQRGPFKRWADNRRRPNCCTHFQAGGRQEFGKGDSGHALRPRGCGQRPRVLEARFPSGL